MNVIKLYECDIFFEPFNTGNRFRITDKNKYYLNVDKIKYFRQYTQDYGKRPVPGVSIIFLENGDSMVVHADVDELADMLTVIDNKDNSNRNIN